MNAWYEEAFGALYPIVYGHRDEEEARRAAATFVGRVPGLGERARVLDVACGDGRYLRALAEKGVERSVGLDLSPQLLERARRYDARCRVVRADMRRIPFVDGAFTHALSMFTSFGYFETDRENLGVLREITRIIQPGGHFVLDYMNAHAVVGAKLESTERVVEGWTIREDRGLECGGKQLVKHVTVTGMSGTVQKYAERLRVYPPAALEEMLDTCGMRIVADWGDYAGTPFDPASSARLVRVCRKGGDA